MTFLELAKKRCSVRNYSSRNVELEKINGLLTAVQLAPSAVNLQPWRVYVVVNEKKKKELQACYDRDWFRTAPVYIVICGNRAESWKRRDGKDHCDVDIAIAAEHLILEATDLGLGSCWVCNFDVRKCKLALNIEADEEEPCVIVPVGYPADEEVWENTEKKRKSIDEFVQYLY